MASSKSRWALLAMLLFAIETPPLSHAVSLPQETPSPSAPKSHRMPAQQSFTYSCDGGLTIKVLLRESTARVIFNNKSYAMKQVESGSGARYSDGSVVWWNKGYEGFLQDESNPDHIVPLAENCKQVSPRPSGNANNPAAAKAPATLTGTVGYRERIAMPQNAVLIVQLQDVSRAGAAAQVIAEEKITMGGRQVPIPFELTYNPRHIHAKHTYSVSARITVDGHLRFVNTTAYHVLTQGNPAKVDMMLQAVERESK
jgi:putative lipoprotein